MHQAKKGQQYYFGMKAHIGVDADSGLVRSVHVTSANERDVANTHALLHGQERRVHADSGYTGVAKREEIANALAKNWARMYSLFALANLVIAKRPLLRPAGVSAP
jgi:IS5 family transposase